MKFLTFFATILAAFAVSQLQACRCPPLQEPQYCQTKYLMLVKITKANVDEAKFQRYYNFELVEDISVTKFKTHFNTIQTGFDGGSCQLTLDAEKYYLLGGYADEKTQNLHATTCNTFWTEWKFRLGSAEGEAELMKIHKECEAYRAHLKTPF